MINTILLAPNGKESICEYCDLGGISEATITQLCEKNPKIKRLFKEFKKRYTYFDPYFDFMMFILKFRVKNVLNLSNSEMYARGNIIYLKYLDQEIELFTASDDKTIGLKKTTEINLDFCMIDGNLNMIAPNIFDKHEFISRQILNNLFMKNHKLYQEYVDDMLEGLFFSYDFSEFLLQRFPYFRIDKNVKTPSTEKYAIFQDRDYYYLIQGYEENMTLEQKEFFDMLVAKRIISQDGIILSTLGRKNDL